jgi:hypothetical protein
MSAFLLLVASGTTADAATLCVKRTLRTSGCFGPIFVELYREGKPVRSLEIIPTSNGSDSETKVTGLPPGQYEMHCHAVGQGKVIKRFYLNDEDETQVVAQVGSDNMETPAIVGGATSLEEIWQLLQKLQKDNADLQAKVDRLEAEIDQLKGTVPRR